MHRDCSLKKSGWSDSSSIPGSHVGQISDPTGWLSQIQRSVVLSQSPLTGVGASKDKLGEILFLLAGSAPSCPCLARRWAPALFRPSCEPRGFGEDLTSISVMAALSETCIGPQCGSRLAAEPRADPDRGFLRPRRTTNLLGTTVNCTCVKVKSP